MSHSYVIRLGNQCNQRYVRTGSNLAALKIDNLDVALQFLDKEQAREWANKHLTGHKFMELTVAVAKRQAVEVEIAKALVLQAIRMGYKLSIDNGGDEPALSYTNHVDAILDTMFATDDERLLYYMDGKYVGWVYLVYGNDGWDVVNDFTTNLEKRKLMTDANLLIDKYCKEWENASS